MLWSSVRRWRTRIRRPHDRGHRDAVRNRRHTDLQLYVHPRAPVHHGGHGVRRNHLRHRTYSPDRKVGVFEKIRLSTSGGCVFDSSVVCSQPWTIDISQKHENLL